MRNRSYCLFAAAAVLLASCSSKPREFTARLEAPPADRVAYEQTHESCRVQVVQGRRSNFLASGAAGTAVAVGTGATMVGTAGSSMFAAAAAASMAVVVMPVVGVAAAWSLARVKKKKKERDVQQAMTRCLAENGHAVDGWQKASRAERSERRTADRARRLALKAQKASGPSATPTPEPVFQSQ